MIWFNLHEIVVNTFLLCVVELNSIHLIVVCFAWQHYHFFVCSFRFLLRNECPRGTRCPYKHVTEASVILNRRPTENCDYVVGRFKNQADQSSPRRQNPYSKTVCYFYSRGICQFGTHCKNLHQNPQRNEQESKNQRNSQIVWKWEKNCLGLDFVILISTIILAQVCLLLPRRAVLQAVPPTVQRMILRKKHKSKHTLVFK